MKQKPILLLLFILLALPTLTIFCGGKKDSNIQHYTCPMHPQIKMESPGQCPICGMDLIPVQKENLQDHTDHQQHKAHQNHHAHEGHQNQNSTTQQIKINPRYMQNIGVVTEKVQVRELTQTIYTYGKIAHDHRLWVAQNEYIEALKLNDRELVQAAERKLLFMGLSKEWIASLEKSKSADITLHLKTNKTKPKYVEAYVSQQDIGRVQEGLSAQITDQKGRFLADGNIKAIGTLVDLNSRSVRVLIESETPLNLKLNTFIQIKIKISLGQKLSVKTQAILFNGDHNMVYLSKGDGIFEPRVIQIGQEAGVYHEILSGLGQGDVIVTNGHFLIDSESQIKMSGAGGHNH